MNRFEAIELMKSATNVEDWNNKREVVKDKISGHEYDATLAEIDGSGLIVQVLGQDLPHIHHSH